VRLDASVSLALGGYSLECSPEPCVFLLEYPYESGLPLYAGHKNRLLVLKDVGDETVVITIFGAQAEKSALLRLCLGRNPAVATPHEQRTMSTSPRLRCCLFYRVGVKYLIAPPRGYC